MNEAWRDEADRECQCYPPSRNYPASLRKGCNGYSQCWVRAESKQLMTPEGRADVRRAYGLECLEAQGRAEQKPSVGDVLHRVQRLGVPASALFAIRNEKPTDCLKAAQDWWASDKRLFPVLALVGDVGQGKTVAAAWCVVEWARGYPWNSLPTGTNQQPMVWLDGPRLRELSSFSEEAQDLLAAAATAELTVVDDAGRDGSPRAIEAVSDVLMERVDRMRATVLTSNLKGEAFKARYGAALADRLRAVAAVPKLAGQSMRKRPS